MKGLILLSNGLSNSAIACRNAPILEYCRDRRKVAVGVGFPRPHSRMIRLINLRSRYFIVL
ncbi:hypothetical protein [Brunnivagina elsteri]|uniref:hypothetical protein n=1 Tax=Brunnivagina elsteri TaxID=1247191 RepID=UPI001177D8AC|nr:hypothetical protein [Calothrix elsteri]